jgi:UDP-N-acetylglucosamine acyltransferase
MIDPRAVVDPAAELEDGVEVGPFSIIGPGVRVGRDTVIGPHAVIRGPTVIGAENRIFQFASVGEMPQDKKYGGEATRLEIGDRNTIRECATIHRGTVQDAGVTRIGSDNLLMAYSHVAHDCAIGDRVILANGVQLAGHVRVDDHAILGGFSLVHQFCTIGAHSFTAMGTPVNKDIPPYVMVGGNPPRPYGINAEGLKRRGFSPETLSVLKAAYRKLYLSGLKLEEAREVLATMAESESVIGPLVVFLDGSRRSIIR